MGIDISERFEFAYNLIRPALKRISQAAIRYEIPLKFIEEDFKIIFNEEAKNILGDQWTGPDSAYTCAWSNGISKDKK